MTDFQVEENETGLTIIGYTGDSTILDIPNSIDGKAVTIIGKEAFSRKKLTKVNFPEMLEVIEEKAFYVNALTSLDLPMTLKTIGNIAFMSNQIARLSTPSSLETIGDRAFDSNMLADVVLADSISHIGEMAFMNNRIKTVNLPAIQEIKSWTFSCNKISKIEIPDSVEWIGDNAFSSNKIKELHLPESVVYCGKASFSENKITNLRLPSGLEEIESNAFEDNCLESLSLPSTLIEIGYAAFRKNKLTKVEIPISVKKIGGFAFAKNELIEITMADSGIEIGEYAFPEIPDPIDEEPTPPKSKRYLEKTEDASRKYWEITLFEKAIRIREGMLDSSDVYEDIAFESADLAAKEFQARLEEKYKDGFLEVPFFFEEKDQSWFVENNYSNPLSTEFAKIYHSTRDVKISESVWEDMLVYENGKTTAIIVDGDLLLDGRLSISEWHVFIVQGNVSCGSFYACDDGYFECNNLSIEKYADLMSVQSCETLDVRQIKVPICTTYSDDDIYAKVDAQVVVDIDDYFEERGEDYEELNDSNFKTIYENMLEES